MWNVGLCAVQFFADVHILTNRYAQQSFKTFRKLLVYVPTDTGSFALQIFFSDTKTKLQLTITTTMRPTTVRPTTMRPTTMRPTTMPLAGRRQHIKR
jgi:hypothetical protein